MLVVLKDSATQDAIETVVRVVEERGYQARVVRSEGRLAVGMLGNDKNEVLPFEGLPDVLEIVKIIKPYKLVSREWNADDTVITLSNGAAIGGGNVCVMAGPCGVESREQLFETAARVKGAGARVLRGGAFKPRTSPYSFHGMGLDGLKLLAEVREQFGLAIITEAIDHASLDQVEEYADIIQIGARNMQNFSLLRRAGQARKPVMLKRGMSATLKEFLLAAEYILAEGNSELILCERGVRSFEDYTRNMLDLNAVPAVKELSHLPIVVDPSHGTGRRSMVSPMACGGVAAGADGIIVEVHCNPAEALSDGDQSLYPDQFDALMRQLKVLTEATNRQLS